MVVALFAGASEGSSLKLGRQRLHSLRGQQIRHHGHHKRHRSSSSNNVEDAQPRDVPLYDDFLDVMNHAAEKALQARRVTNAYDDFKSYMKNSRTTDQGEHLDVDLSDDMPSKEDFKLSLKASIAEADKEPVPSYDDFLAILVAGAEQAMRDREMHATDAEKLQNSGAQRSDASGPFDAIAKGVETAGKVMDKTQEKAENAVTGQSRAQQRRDLRNEMSRLRQIKESRGPIPQAKKPLMKKINVLRTELCWKRPNLMKHEKCLRFLGISCFEESTGLGICHDFTEDVTQACKSETDPEWKDDYCALADALSDSYGEEEEEAKSQESDGTGEAAESGSDEHGERSEAVKEAGYAEDKVIEDDLEEALKQKDEKLKEKTTKDGSGVDSTKAEDGDAGKDVSGSGKVGENGSDSGVVDSDGDGVTDDKDVFPNDASEWADTDKDGVGDKADTDIDGDGKPNSEDVFPNDPKEWSDIDHDGVGDNADDDRDNDGYPNDKDAFPNDPSEWKDSDKDGIGDNKDSHPFNPNCHDPNEPCEDVSKDAAPKKGSSQDPATLDMSARRKLPEQGYNEHSEGPRVSHSNYYTWVGDWQDEWPVDEEKTEKQEIKEICRLNPASPWCKKYFQAADRGQEGTWR